MCTHQDGERRRIPRPCAPTPAAIPIAPYSWFEKQPEGRAGGSAKGSGEGRPVPADLRGESETLD
jgi:hypothetical protein